MFYRAYTNLHTIFMREYKTNIYQHSRPTLVTGKAHSVSHNKESSELLEYSGQMTMACDFLTQPPNNYKITV